MFDEDLGQDELFAPELMARVRQIQLRTRRMVSEVLTGAYRSTFRGSGIEFDDIRPYQPGDDVRSIDWKRTARAGDAYIKTYIEERELSLVFAVDTSRSMDFGSREFTKREVAAQLVALLSYVAARQHDRVGLVLFGEEVGFSLPPKKGADAVARVIREVLAARPTAGKRSFENAIEHCARSLGRHSLLFFVSDFAADELREPGRLPPWSNALSALGRRHDIVLARVADPFETEPPPAGWLTLEGLESEARIDVDTRSEKVRQAWRAAAAARKAAVAALAKRSDLDQIELSTDGNVADPIGAFFSARGRRRRGSR
ncbi:MAG TPA: DUF58 domain-containing protein [Planctomycetota bacterium]|nr:DUF58 domain-containing protein [Planctomycetota bacterium]